MASARLAAFPRHLRYLSKPRPVLLFPHATLSSPSRRVRYSSHSPPAESSTPARQKTTIQILQTLHQRGEPITVLTAHDFPSGHVADEAGIEVVLVGDSLAMVSLGINLLRDAIAVQKAGAFMILIEAVPAEVAALVTKCLRVPTIGIGSGNGCSGQVLVQIDMTGNFPPGRFIPKFVKVYADVWGESLRGLEAYKHDVKSRAFPSPYHTYPISNQDLEEFQRLVDSNAKGEGMN